jgi:hypothetical protein
MDIEPILEHVILKYSMRKKKAPAQKKDTSLFKVAVVV